MALFPSFTCSSMPREDGERPPSCGLITRGTLRGSPNCSSHCGVNDPWSSALGDPRELWKGAWEQWEGRLGAVGSDHHVEQALAGTHGAEHRRGQEALTLPGVHRPCSHGCPWLAGPNTRTWPAPTLHMPGRVHSEHQSSSVMLSSKYNKHYT